MGLCSTVWHCSRFYRLCFCRRSVGRDGRGTIWSTDSNSTILDWTNSAQSNDKTIFSKLVFRPRFFSCGLSKSWESRSQESVFPALIWQIYRSTLQMSCTNGKKWKWSNSVLKSKTGIFWWISITNNVKSYKKFDEKAQTGKFTVFTMWNQLRGAKNMDY